MPEINNQNPRPKTYPKVRTFFTKCDDCSSTILWGGRTYKGKVYCDLSCRNTAEAPEDFCPTCLSKSSDHKHFPGSRSINYIGTSTIGNAEQCPFCFSTIKTKVIVLGLPIVPLASYRMIEVEDGRYIGRKVPAHLPHVGQVLASLAFVAAIVLLVIYS